MSGPVISIRDLIQSDLDLNMYYRISAMPDQDFELDVGGHTIVMTPSRGFYDRGAKCYEWRPADWMNYNDWRSKIYVRFYSPTP